MFLKSGLKAPPVVPHCFTHVSLFNAAWQFLTRGEINSQFHCLASDKEDGRSVVRQFRDYLYINSSIETIW
ncbi:hypothetical protein N9B43_07680 [Mariniblastus sp.]|nr:hypothetical protein [Mariniblastus sp.]